jgi:hypothetical protein
VKAQKNAKPKTVVRHCTAPPTPIRLWVNANREQLKAKFHRNFGLQMHEWPDFIEAEYQKSVTA